MILMLCSECQGELYLAKTKYYSLGGNKYRMIYVLVDENNHKAEIQSEALAYNPDKAEARIIKHLIEYTQTQERLNPL